LSPIDRPSLRLITSGKPLAEAAKALVLIHGRGATAEDILAISESLSVDDFALLAPQAANGAWYPVSFLSPPQQNEPWLSFSLNALNDILKDLNHRGISSERTFLLGFSQGACLVLEFAARNAQPFGGVIAFTGALIGDKLYPMRYKGDFKQTRIFIGTSDPDPHVPPERVKASAELLRQMNAKVTVKVYRNMGHRVNDDEIAEANAILAGRRDRASSG